MITIKYCSVEELKGIDFDYWSNLLPLKMQKDICKYKYEKERMASLLGKILLFDSLVDDRRPELIDRYEKYEHAKPFIFGWDFFNLSHSGKWVLFGKSDHEIGVDIESTADIDFISLMSFFHPEEKKVILNGDLKSNFYKVWVRKESFLKATGIGLTDALKDFNCINDSINFKKKAWYFHEVEFDDQYAVCICSSHKNPDVTLKKFLLLELRNKLTLTS